MNLLRAICLFILTALPAFCASVHSAMLTWAYGDTTGISFTVYRASGASAPPTSDFLPVATAITTKAYTDLAVAAGTPYWYYVTAVAAGSESVPSNIAGTLIPVFPPTSVQALLSSGVVAVTWAASPDAGTQTYSVYRSPTPCNQTPTWSRLASGLMIRSYTDKTITAGSYCFGVSATIFGVESSLAASSTVSVSAQPPTGLTIQVI